MVFPPDARLDRESCVREVQPTHTECKGDVNTHHETKSKTMRCTIPFGIRHSISPRSTSGDSLHLPSPQERS